MTNYYSVIPHGRSELYHYGIPGMKWGVRKSAQYLGRTASSAVRLKNNIGERGLIRGTTTWHAQNVKNRLDSMSDIRKRNMSNRQMKSYDLSKKYWDQRASGKSHRQIKKEKKVAARGIIKRTMDTYRSYSTQARMGATFANAFIQTAKSNRRISSIVSTKGSYAFAALKAAESIGIDELINKGFGHY